MAALYVTEESTDLSQTDQFRECRAAKNIFLSGNLVNGETFSAK